MKFALSATFVPPAEVATLAKAAEEAGFDVLAMAEHVLHPEKINAGYAFAEDGVRPWGESTEWPEPLTTMSYVAACTKTIELMTAIFVLPIRNPFLVAQAISTLSQLAGRRIYFGVGSGWSDDESRLMQQDFSTRGSRFDEMIQVLRLLWRGEMVEYHGAHYDFDRLIMLPKPAMEVPFLIGGDSEAALRRAVRLGNGWISPPWNIAEGLKTVNTLRDMLRAEGRENDPFDFVLCANDCFKLDEVKKARDAGVAQIVAPGSLLQKVFARGDRAENTGLAAKIKGIERFAELIINPCR